jgi:hypothetical protein
LSQLQCIDAIIFRVCNVEDELATEVEGGHQEKGERRRAAARRRAVTHNSLVHCHRNFPDSHRDRRIAPTAKPEPVEADSGTAEKKKSLAPCLSLDLKQAQIDRLPHGQIPGAVWMQLVTGPAGCTFRHEFRPKTTGLRIDHGLVEINDAIK